MKKQTHAPKFQITNIFVILLCCLNTTPSYADKIYIPIAMPITAKSVELWKQCKEENSRAKGCANMEAGKVVSNSKEFEEPLDFDKYKSEIMKSKLAPAAQIPEQLQDQIQAQTPLGSFDQKLLVALSDFLVDRAKQEARLYLQEQLSDKFCESDEDNKTENKVNGKKYFPKTCLVIDQLKKSSISMSGTTAMLQAAIHDDFRNYPDRYFELKFNRETDDAKKQKWLYARIAAEIYSESRGGRSAAEIIGGLAELNEADCPANLCTSITSKATIFWVLSENVRQLREYLGSDYAPQKSLALRYAIAGTMLDSRISNLLPTNRQSIAERFTGISAAFETLQDYRKAILALEAKADPLKTEQANIALRLQSNLLGINTIIQLSSITDSNGVHNALRDLQTATELAQAITEQDYPRIILNTVMYAEDHDQNSQYLSLLAELASANSSADMQKVFEAAAAPAGSYREKFKSDTLTTITAFAGVTYNNEWYNVNGATRTNDWQPYLPIGVQQTWNHKNGVFGAFVSIIDLGPLAANRQINGTDSNNTNVGWAQAFSPGIFATWNPYFLKPIVIGAGISRTPRLFTGNTGEQISATRKQVFIAIDMTLFAFR